MTKSSLSLLLLLLFKLSPITYAQKIDSIYHINGNILTGDFKKLAYGVATYKMSGMGTISVDEYVISSIKSQKIFEIKVKQGWVYYGSLDTSIHARKLNVVAEGTRHLLDIPEIIEIYPIQNNFWKRLSGNFGLGYEFSKGSDIGKLNTNGKFSYRKQKTNWDFSWDTHTTFESDSIKSSKSNTSLNYERFMRPKWSFAAMVGSSHNSELGLRTRLFLSTIIIRDLKYTNIQRFYIGTGLMGGPEWKYGIEKQEYVLNGVIVLNYSIYKLSSPSINLDSQIAFLPYISDIGRQRLNINIYPKIEVVNNFDVGLKFYYELDTGSEQSETTSKSDWGINLAISYSFH